MKSSKNVIVGAGLVGSLLAIYLGRSGHSVEVYERRSDPRETEVCEGRSFELALSQRGLAALQRVGIEEAVLDLTTPMPGRMIHRIGEEDHFQPYGTRVEDNLHAISRNSLNKVLLDLAEQSGDVTVNFDANCLGYDEKRLELGFQGPNKQTFGVKAERVFGTDGSSSALRNKVGELTGSNPKRVQVDYTYKRFTIPANEVGGYQLEPHAFHIWPRGKYLMIAQANQNGSFSNALFLPQNGEISLDSMGEGEIEDFFEDNFPDVSPLMPNLRKEYLENPSGCLYYVKCPRWHFKDQVLLLGDAAHAIVPFYGQGMNCGFEDVAVLDEIISKHSSNWQTVFNTFEESRKPDTTAIADLSLRNMKEMADGVNDPYLLRAKEIAHNLAVRFPEEIRSTHAMVTAHPEISYSCAMRMGDILDETTLNVARNVGCADDVDLNLVRNRVLDRYETLGLNRAARV